MAFPALSRPAGMVLACACCAALAQAPAPAADAKAAPAAGAFSAPVDAAELDRMRGGQAVVNDMRLDGTTAGNTARDIATGNNSISAGSFANMTGLPVVVQNSGANVLIQNATIIHLQMN